MPGATPGAKGHRPELIFHTFLYDAGWRGMFTAQFQNNDGSRQNIMFPFYQALRVEPD